MIVDVRYAVSIERQYLRLQEQRKIEHQVLSLLRTAHSTYALRILDCLQSGDDVRLVLELAQELASIQSRGCSNNANFHGQSCEDNAGSETSEDEQHGNH